MDHIRNVHALAGELENLMNDQIFLDGPNNTHWMVCSVRNCGNIFTVSKTPFVVSAYCPDCESLCQYGCGYPTYSHYDCNGIYNSCECE